MASELDYLISTLDMPRSDMVIQTKTFLAYFSFPINLTFSGQVRCTLHVVLNVFVINFELIFLFVLTF